MAKKRHGERGYSPTSEYATWNSMCQRCNNPKSQAYARYGGRGITVCTRWNSYENFLADMGRRPSSKHQIDRINNDGPYSPENCRWATAKENGRNKRNNRLLSYKGETLTLAEWADRTGKHSNNISNALKRGRTMEDIIEGYDKRKYNRTSSKHYITYDGQTRTVGAWAKLLNTDYSSMLYRFKKTSDPKSILFGFRKSKKEI